MLSRLLRITDFKYSMSLIDDILLSRLIEGRFNYEDVEGIDRSEDETTTSIYIFSCNNIERYRRVIVTRESDKRSTTSSLNPFINSNGDCHSYSDMIIQTTNNVNVNHNVELIVEEITQEDKKRVNMIYKTERSRDAKQYKIPRDRDSNKRLTLNKIQITKIDDDHYSGTMTSRLNDTIIDYFRYHDNNVLKNEYLNIVVYI